jgi:hypothetical protein
MPSRLVVEPSVSTAAEPQGRPPLISASERGPGRGSIGERSQATAQPVEQVGNSEGADDVAAPAHADQQGAVSVLEGVQGHGFAISRTRLSPQTSVAAAGRRSEVERLGGY